MINYYNLNCHRPTNSILRVLLRDPLPKLPHDAGAVRIMKEMSKRGIFIKILKKFRKAELSAAKINYHDQALFFTQLLSHHEFSRAFCERVNTALLFICKGSSSNVRAEDFKAT